MPESLVPASRSTPTSVKRHARVKQLSLPGEAWSTALNRLLEALPSRGFILGRLLALFSTEEATSAAALDQILPNPAAQVALLLATAQQQRRERQAQEIMGTLPANAFALPLSGEERQDVAAGWASEHLEPSDR